MSSADVSTNTSFLRTWAPLMAVCTGFFVVVLDSTMMNVAVPAIAKDLNTTVSGVQAAIALYSMVMASLMLVGGKLGDIYGVKRMFMVGMGLYGAGTLLAASSWNLGVLIIGWSVIEGVGAALILPLAFSLIFGNYSAAQRPLAFGALGAINAVGAAVGPILGGTLTTYLTWRIGFGIEAIGVAIVFLLMPFLKESEKDEQTSLDWIGTILSFVSLTLVVSGLILAGRYGFWDARRPFMIGDVEISPFGLSITPVLVATGFAVALAFFHWQTRRERHGETPLLRLDLFSNRDFFAGALADGLRSLFFFGLLFIVPVFIQSAARFSAIESGVALIPLSAAVFVLSLTTAGLGRVVAPKFIIIAGFAVMFAGTLLYYDAMSVNVSIADLILPGLVFGFGGGIVIPQITNLPLSAVTPSEVNEASGLANTMRTLGTALGTAVIGSILLVGVYGEIVDGVLTEQGIDVSFEERQQLAVDLEDGMASLSEEDRNEAIAGLSPGDQETLKAVVEKAATDAQKTALLATAAAILLALLASTFLSRAKAGVAGGAVTVAQEISETEAGRP